MKPINSYLISAWFDWMTDNGYSPHLVVSTEYQNVIVPQSFIKDNQIVLCIDADAVDELKINPFSISFVASFQGLVQTCSFPVCAVKAIYDIDSGQGTVLPELVQEDSPNDGGFMRVVK